MYVSVVYSEICIFPLDGAIGTNLRKAWLLGSGFDGIENGFGGFYVVKGRRFRNVVLVEIDGFQGERHRFFLQLTRIHRIPRIRRAHLRDGEGEGGEESEKGTVGQNQVILRHQKFTFPRASEVSERANE